MDSADLIYLGEKYGEKLQAAEAAEFETEFEYMTDCIAYFGLDIGSENNKTKNLQL